VGLTSTNGLTALLPIGNVYVEPVAKDAGNVNSNGPFIKAVVDVLVIAPVAVPVILKILELLVVIFPLPALNVSAAEDKLPPDTINPFEFDRVILFTVLVGGISNPVVLFPNS
jgi:hypothetical protein